MQNAHEPAEEEHRCRVHPHGHGCGAAERRQPEAAPQSVSQLVGEAGDEQNPGQRATRPEQEEAERDRGEQQRGVVEEGAAGQASGGLQGRRTQLSGAL